MEAEISYMAEPLTLTGKFSAIVYGATCMGATFTFNGCHVPHCCITGIPFAQVVSP